MELLESSVRIIRIYEESFVYINKGYDEHMNLIIEVIDGEEKVNGHKENALGYTINKPVVFIRGDMVVTVSKEL